jgi:hypothetical protein
MRAVNQCDVQKLHTPTGSQVDGAELYNRVKRMVRSSVVSHTAFPPQRAQQLSGHKETEQPEAAKRRLSMHEVIQQAKPLMPHLSVTNNNSEYAHTPLVQICLANTGSAPTFNQRKARRAK